MLDLMPRVSSEAPRLHVKRARDCEGRKVAQILLGAPTMGKGECPGRGLWWRELKEANKSPSRLKYTKMASKIAGFPHFLALKSPKAPFFAPKCLIRHMYSTSKMFF
jgi:hypothetical protein